MGEQQGPGQAEQQGPGPEQGGEPRVGERKQPKAKLVFGDPLDRQSGDDTDSGWGGGSGSGSGSASGRGLDWYVSQRPPHHGG
ncbi:hypothetical protein GCM10009760_37490 [Kitasatospora kazusensis]|uniref:Uncharacterized protein n=1 Tax=Kitasatospora kazusensis TaxID=407974 RepID=A0ABN2ZSY7_9ACTN